MKADIVAQINVDKLRHNLGILRGCCRVGTTVCAVMKADAYGHDASVVIPTLQDCGVKVAAVATLGEAVELRRFGWRGRVAVFGNPLATPHAGERRDRICAILDHDCDIVISGAEYVEELAEIAGARGEIVDVHLKVDSGMGRQGVMPHLVLETLRCLSDHASLRLRGICTHFAAAENQDSTLTMQQLDSFRRVLCSVEPSLPPGIIRHVCNTAATLEIPQAHFDMVRCGLGLYGYAPTERALERFSLQPILRVLSRVALVKQLPPGHAVGYGPRHTTSRPTRIGIIPVGYADGLDRRLAGSAVVGTSAGDAPILGQISMDQLTVDLTDLPEVQVGDEVVLIDDDPQRPNSVARLASQLGTIPYEITCRLGPRMQRVAVGSRANRQDVSCMPRVVTSSRNRALSH